MSTFAVIFSIAILSLFWGGFIGMLLYSLKLKSRETQDSPDNE